MPEPSLTPHPERLRLLGVVTVVVLLVVGAFWWLQRDDAPGPAAEPETAASTPAPTASHAASSGPSATTSPDRRPSASSTAQPLPEQPRIVVISVDGLASYAVTREQTPTIERMLTEGAGTLNARTEVERTVTLPNHTGMVTGRRIDAGAGGHGVTWNVDTPRNVRAGVSSVFSGIHAADGSSAVFAGKSKFRMWDRSWPGTIDHFDVDADLNALTGDVIADLASTPRDLVFFHIAATDVAGHAHGWDSPAYDAAARRADRAVARVVAAITADPERAADTLVVLTADHGGTPGTRGHDDASRLVDFQIPFVVWGPGVAARDLYDLNPDYADPGDAQPGYTGPQPVRNGDVANLVLDLLGLPALPGSQLDVRQDLDVR